MLVTVQTSQVLAEEHGVPCLDYGQVVQLAVAQHSRTLGTLSTQAETVRHTSRAVIYMT